MKSLKTGLLLIAFTTVVAGCASNSDLAEVRTLAKQAKAQAQAAAVKADTALNASQQANANSEAAFRKAEEVDAKTDNMFKKAMQK